MRQSVTAFVFVIGTFFGAQFSLGQSAVLQLSGLQTKVTVRRDARSIPYIQANNDGDLYFTQGYVTAGDRLWQMDLMRRLARGETALARNPPCIGLRWPH